ncbi:iron-sulfur cluster biosynthesis family protein [Cohnella nanjingensis]|uniref:Iron-sulfur cluster biosynthesis family protein n=1 Tax=Cohnella nanjingensis TaxID=1387779 RepID=A0A7X0RKH6_9BACL|nr:iron-sulfur cluster biosynthesis family protein [Cohnella nanjingensis]MBB6669138.1 iron-sulfur cluster biosynthesis family protein [Cohnella nanjingensis]
MEIKWSAEAVEALRTRFGPDARIWKLVSDSEGCGCAVSGVPTLWALDAPLPDDIRADSEPVALWYEKRHEVYFDDVMRITYDAAKRSFTLASDGQIYTNRLATVDRRTEVGNR